MINKQAESFGIEVNMLKIQIDQTSSRGQGGYSSDDARNSEWRVRGKEIKALNLSRIGLAEVKMQR